MTKLTTVVFLFLSTLASALPDGARDGKYSCGHDKYVVRVTLDTARPWIRLDDENGVLEGMPLYRTDKRYEYDEYVLPSDTTAHAFYLRFWKQGPVTWHFCWSCGAFTCARE